MTWPLKYIFGFIVSIRWQLYRLGIFSRRAISVPVVSVGNITLGGTGKTPFVTWLADAWSKSGRSVGILTRGYSPHASSKVPPVDLVSEVLAAEEDWGGAWTSEEVWVMRRRLRRQGVRFGVGSDRYHWARHFQKRGVQRLLLDDGFQHTKLRRDIDIVLVDALDPFGGRELFPTGRLREPVSALARADFLVLTRAIQDTEPLETEMRRYSGAPIYRAIPELAGVFQFRVRQNEFDKPDWKHRKFYAYCGIGNPAGFLNDLKRWGITVVGNTQFPDHYVLDEEDARKLCGEARQCGAEGLICTEKDVLNAHGFYRIEPDLPLYYCRINLHVERGEELLAAIENAIDEGPARR